ncbi:MAG: class I SAM-dependent methyltransferase [bacterium]
MGEEHRQDWDRYWRGAGGLSVFGQFSANANALQEFWSNVLSGALAGPERPRMLDVACGSGAVTAIAMQLAEKKGGAGVTCVSLDYSASAVSDLRRRMPKARPVVSEAGAAPFADATFYVVVSQFGLEYAGPAAFAEAARLVAPDGVFCALCHLDSGPIHRECQNNLEVLESACRFLPLAKSAFRAQFALNRGDGPAHKAEAAHEAFLRAAATLESLVREKGMGAANGTPARLHRDTMYMYRRRRNFEPRQVLDWIDGMTDEITAYAGRMRAMTEAALDEAAIREIHRSLMEAGLEAEDPAKLGMGPDAEPGAWIIRASRVSGTERFSRPA